MAGLVVVPPADNVLAVVGVEAADRALRSTHDVSDAAAHAVVRQCDGTLLRVTVLVVSETTKIAKVLSPKRTGTIEPLMGDLERSLSSSQFIAERRVRSASFIASAARRSAPRFRRSG
jgi:hypothetical protein